MPCKLWPAHPAAVLSLLERTPKNKKIKQEVLDKTISPSKVPIHNKKLLYAAARRHIAFSQHQAATF